MLVTNMDMQPAAVIDQDIECREKQIEHLLDLQQGCRRVCQRRTPQLDSGIAKTTFIRWWLELRDMDGCISSKIPFLKIGARFTDSVLFARHRIPVLQQDRCHMLSCKFFDMEAPLVGAIVIDFVISRVEPQDEFQLHAKCQRE